MYLLDYYTENVPKSGIHFYQQKNDQYPSYAHNTGNPQKQ